MHADDAGPEHQAGAVFEQLMEQAGAVAQMTGYQQGCQAGTDGDHDGEGEQRGLVIGHRIRTHGGHAHVMHGGDAQADADRRLQILPETQAGMAEGMHGQPRGEQGDQQREKGDGQVVLDVDRRLERQHANEMHGPDPARQASGADPAPEPLRGGFFHVTDPFGHVQCGKAADAGDQIGQQHQKRVMCAIEYDLAALRQLGNEMQTKPLHSMPHCHPGRRHERWRMLWSIEGHVSKRKR